MKVLVACEESQRVCTAFRDLGHEAYSCDIVPTSGDHPEWHFQGDVREMLDWGWDMIIAFPPCTYMSIGSACRMYPTKGVLDEDRFKKSQEAKKFFMEIMNADCPRIAIENPRPLKIVGLPKETQQIQPWQFGDPYTKLTYLWLKNLPQLIPTHNMKDIATPWVNAGSKKADGTSRDKQGVKSHSIDRSKTFWGVARAMAQQFGGQV